MKRFRAEDANDNTKVHHTPQGLIVKSADQPSILDYPTISLWGHIHSGDIKLSCVTCASMTEAIDYVQDIEIALEDWERNWKGWEPSLIIHKSIDKIIRNYDNVRILLFGNSFQEPT